MSDLKFKNSLPIESPEISAALAAQQGKQWNELRTSGHWLGWLEFDPVSSSNRIQILDLESNKKSSFSTTPAGFSAQSRVHEYGGGAWCFLSQSAQESQQLAFVNGADQALYKQSLFKPSHSKQDLHHLSSSPECFFSREHCRYGDLTPVPGFSGLVAVEEDHSASDLQPVNRLVVIGLDGTRTVLAEGEDFYSSPTFNEQGNKLAWLSWNHPRQPWLSTTLNLAQTLLSNEGLLSCERLEQWNSAGKDFSLYQPGFDAHDNLLVVSDQPQDSESDGFWKLVRCADCESADCETESGDQNRHREFEANLYLSKPGEEMGVAQWQLGTRTWTVGDGKLIGSGLIDGQAWLGWLESGNPVQKIELSGELAARFHSLCWNEKTGAFYALMESADRPCQVVEVGANSIIPLATLSVELPKMLVNPESIQIRTATGNLYSHFYPAVNSDNEWSEFGSNDGLNVEPDTDKVGGIKAAPLVIQLHGGPTAYADASLDMQKQYWPANGFHLLVLNYRGSSGFGRTYRHALKNNWGITDVEDVFSACQYLVQQGWAEPGAIFIRGNSAGGYTVLAALSDCNAREVGIAGGASLYGISDLELLNQHTHKFESEYLSWLIGDPEVNRQRYRERSAIHRLNDFELPVIFFQGANDRVVPPDQTQRIHYALKEKGVATEYCLFAGEGHGFRKAANRQTVLERELAFYLCQLKIGS